MICEKCKNRCDVCGGYIFDVLNTMPKKNMPSGLNNVGTGIDKCDDKTCPACHPTIENIMVLKG